MLLNNIECFNRNINTIHKYHHQKKSLNILVKQEDPIRTKFPSFVSNVNENIISIIKKLLIVLYDDNNIYARFAALELIARVPYFSYISVLHLQETLGKRDNDDIQSNLSQIHFKETENEKIHLLIMEDLGGNKEFKHRLYAQHIAFAYYWIVVIIYLISPSTAYDLNYHVEKHAFNTYDNYLKENENQLKEQHEIPEIAQEYYNSLNRNVKTLYDVFKEIRDDEAEHSDMMVMLRETKC